MNGRPTSFRAGRNRAQGFTLLELMITVAVIGILAAIAYPSYRDSVLKGKRAQGRAALLDLMTQQERYLTQNGSYLQFSTTATSATDAAQASVSPIPFKTFSGDNSTSAAYKLGARPCSGGAASTLRSCVQVYATPTNVSIDPLVTELNVMSTGAKDCSPSTTAKSVCWP